MSNDAEAMRGSAGPAARRREVARLAGWLRSDVWPFWLEHGVDWRRRGFHEHLDAGSRACGAAFRRLRVLTRQVYSFSEAARHEVPRAREAVELGVEALLATRGADGGHPWRFDLDHRPTDETRDLYDHAFVLFAFAGASRVPGFEGLRDEARRTFAFIDERLRHPGRGFLESLPPAARRRQNPHMHLYEAVLAAHDAFGDPPYLALADEILALFVDTLYQHGEGALPEFFDEDLRPEREDGRFVVEPGHHYEWAWLLARHDARRRPAGAAGAAEVARRLLAFADRHGIDGRTGLVVDALDSRGAVLQPGFRMWPQAERLKCEARRPPDAAADIGAIWRMIDGAPSGLWHERLDADGRPAAGVVPASSLYHLTSAIADAEACLAGP